MEPPPPPPSHKQNRMMTERDKINILEAERYIRRVRAGAHSLK